MTALNFPDSPSNGDTYQGYTYNSTKTTWAKPADSSTTVVANVAALPTSAAVGDQAFVTATNRLYLWNGTGWYNIALINTNPSISGANASPKSKCSINLFVVLIFLFCRFCSFLFFPYCFMLYIHETTLEPR